jgi:hypothetical protein
MTPQEEVIVIEALRAMAISLERIADRLKGIEESLDAMRMDVR